MRDESLRTMTMMSLLAVADPEMSVGSPPSQQQQPSRPMSADSKQEDPPSPTHAEVNARRREERLAIGLGAISEVSETSTQPSSVVLNGAAESTAVAVAQDAGVVSSLEKNDGGVLHPHQPSSETSEQAMMTPLSLSSLAASNGSTDDCSHGYAESAISTVGPCSPEPGEGLVKGKVCTGGEATDSSPPCTCNEDGGITEAVTTDSSSIAHKESQDGNLSDASSLLDNVPGRRQESAALGSLGEQRTSTVQSNADVGCDGKDTLDSPVFDFADSGSKGGEGSVATLAKQTCASLSSHSAAKDGSAGSAQEMKTTISSSSAEMEAVPIQTVPTKGKQTGRSPLPTSPRSATSAASGYDKKRLSERLRQRLAKRNQMLQHARPAPKKPEGGDPDAPGASEPPSPRSRWETRLQAASRQRRRSAPSSPRAPAAAAAPAGLLPKDDPGAAGAGGVACPDTVSFSDGEGDAPPALRVDTRDAARRYASRKAVSEVGVSLSQSTRSYRSKLRSSHPHHHGIGILQANGIVYDDALLLRLARQARYGRLRGEVSSGAADSAAGATVGERRFNKVKIHVYDLLTKDALVEVPYFNCNFPVGECFKVVNDGCHSLGTGAYHVGVEVNGVEYAFGANSVTGLSGIFTCVPKESPGYEYREELDFGKQYTTKRTWIRVPKSGTGASFQTISEALGGPAESEEEKMDGKGPRMTKKGSPNEMYSFREVETFADGHAIVHSMAREYLGTDYDLLRKNCCTFARDVCIRLGVKEEAIPRWFHNAAQAGADAEDAITSVEYSVRNLLDCTEAVDPLDLETYNHGFEIILPNGRSLEDKMTSGLKVVESPTLRTPRERTPLEGDNVSLSDMQETASWTY